MTHDDILLNRLINAGRQRKLSRRSFMGNATAAGLTATAATGSVDQSGFGNDTREGRHVPGGHS